MLTIRQEQTEAFRQHHLQKFEDEMVMHLKKFAARHWKMMGDEDGRRVIGLGMERAKGHGFTNRGPIRFYIELMFMFGSYFDTDPQYPWAKAALQDPNSLDQMLRADRLYNRMNDYLAQVSGPEHQYLVEATQRLSEVRVEDFVSSGQGLEASILRAARAVYPQKYDYLGEQVVRTLIRHGFELAQRYGFESDKGKILMVILTFSVGHGFPKDPLNRWIVRRLDTKRWPDEYRRVDELYSKAQLYLEHIVAGGSKD